MPSITPTPTTTLRRHPNRGCYDGAVINSILDEGLVCHVGFVCEGRPFVLPANYARVDDSLYFHGSRQSRMWTALREGGQACVTVTLLDGLVLARAAAHHSMNYRSVVVMGQPCEVTEFDEKLRALEAIVEHFVPGRLLEARRPSESEVARTSVLRLPIIEASAKIRTGPPLDSEEDRKIPCWVGVVPLRLEAGPPVSDPLLGCERPPPSALLSYRRGR